VTQVDAELRRLYDAIYKATSNEDRRDAMRAYLDFCERAGIGSAKLTVGEAGISTDSVH
jgi:hypothetical protein